MAVHLSGSRDGVDWPAIGEVLIVPADEAASLIASGLASAGAEPAVETATTDSRRKK